MSTLHSVWSMFVRMWQRKTGKVMLGVAGLFVACVICMLCVQVISLTPQFRESATRVAQRETATAQMVAANADATATEKAKPTNTSLPTNTSAPTNSPPPSETPKPTNSPAPTDIPEPTEAHSATRSVVPTSQADVKASGGGLPGLAPVDVTLNLKQRGFDCTGVEQGKLYFTWTCTRSDNAIFQATIFVYARTLNTVDLVDANVLQFASPTDDIPKQILGFLATLPYDGASPQAARTWVEDELPKLKGQGDVREKLFGTVKYRLYGIPTARTLEIGDLE